MKVYKFRLYPTKKQQKLLFNQFENCRFVYNQLLNELSRSIDQRHIQHFLLELKERYPELRNVYSKTLQYECYRLFNNIKNLNKSKKIGNKVGKLRFKGRNRFKTICYNQSGFKLIKQDKRYNILHLSKIGDLKLLQHREINGKIKGIIIKRKVNSWEAHFITDVRSKFLCGKEVIGIDLGVLSFITDSNNNKIENPLFMNRSLEKIQNLSKQLSKTEKNSNNRRKVIFKLNRLWEKIENQKNDFFHKITNKLVNKCKFIAIEDLNIKKMTLNKNNKYYNHRNILDSSWGKFLQMLDFKAESAGCQVVKVNPKDTSKICSNCNNLKDMPLSRRIYKCKCGLEIDRDYNAAKNILNKALERGYVETESNLSVKQEAVTLK